MSTYEIIRKLEHHKKNKTIDKLITILELCDFNHLAVESIEDLLTIDEIRLLTISLRSILKEKNAPHKKIIQCNKMDRPMDELMNLFNGLCM
jgi:hypothetical protein